MVHKIMFLMVNLMKRQKRNKLKDARGEVTEMLSKQKTWSMNMRPFCTISPQIPGQKFNVQEQISLNINEQWSSTLVNYDAHDMYELKTSQHQGNNPKAITKTYLHWYLIENIQFITSPWKAYNIHTTFITENCLQTSNTVSPDLSFTQLFW